MIMGPFGLNGFILDISRDILFGWLIFHPTALSLGRVSVRENVTNAIKHHICNDEKAAVHQIKKERRKGENEAPNTIAS